MKKIMFTIFTIFSLTNIVNAASCSLEEQVQVNNEAGAVNATAEPFQYSYYATNSETDEEEEVVAYTGMIYVNNITENIYVIVSSSDDISNKYTYSDAIDGTITINTGGMGSVKAYTVSVYAVNTKCDKSAIRELTVTVPRRNSYHDLSLCNDNPDYLYCQEFTTLDDIDYVSFYNGVSDYASSKKKAEDEERKSGVFEEATSFIKTNWLVILFIIIIIIGCAYVFIKKKNKSKKDKKEKKRRK